MEMNNLWQNLSVAERMASVQAAAKDRRIEDRAVEKDWWVTIILKALFNTGCGPFLLFKGGTSLSKGWGLIQRFSEDIDIAIDRKFYRDVLDCAFAAGETNSQLMRLRKASRDYIHGALSPELEAKLKEYGVQGFTVENVTEAITETGTKPIDHDSDPTVINVFYSSLFPEYSGDIDSCVKIEISCLSMDEPFENRKITSLINQKFDDTDTGSGAVIRTVKPSRTFLEKCFLLNEEFQKQNPRSRRMSRHLYDIEKIMDTPYGREALADVSLYKSIVEHRRRFYHLGYVNYDADYPAEIDFIPKGEVLEAFRKDYNDNMVNGYIYGEAIDFDSILRRMTDLKSLFRKLKI